jgi:hypothetical protein
MLSWPAGHDSHLEVRQCLVVGEGGNNVRPLLELRFAAGKDKLVVIHKTPTCTAAA